MHSKKHDKIITSHEVGHKASSRRRQRIELFAASLFNTRTRRKYPAPGGAGTSFGHQMQPAEAEQQPCDALRAASVDVFQVGALEMSWRCASSLMLYWRGSPMPQCNQKDWNHHIIFIYFHHFAKTQWM